MKLKWLGIVVGLAGRGKSLALSDLLPALNSNQLELPDGEVAKRMEQALSAMLTTGKGEAGCLACKAGVQALRLLCKTEHTRSLFLRGAKSVCQAAARQESQVCQGLADSVGTSLFDVFRDLPLFDDLTPAMVCYSFGNICPMPVIRLEGLPLPDRKRRQPPTPAPRGVKRVLHLTDIHFDMDYLVGGEAECNKPICCQKDSSPQVTRPAREWGEYKCDANEKLIDSLLRDAANRHGYDLLLFTGDIPAHDIWKESASRNAKTAARVFEMLQRHFPTTPIYPALGNHEAAPLNQFPFRGNSSLYAFLAEAWGEWIPRDQLASVRRGGYYAVRHSKQLTVLALNTNIYFISNYQAFLDPRNSDPHGMLQWLIRQLQAAEDSGTHVYITAHIPPGSTDFYQHWSDAFHRIVLRYADTIVGQFYGHLHYDEFELFYNGTTKSRQTAVNTAYLAPSMSTRSGINPSYRVYDVARDYRVLDYHQFYANLRNQQRWKGDAEWELLYSAAQTYSSSLTPASWHGVTTALATNHTLFETFWRLRKADGEIEPCDASCQARQVCSLRAGTAKDNCVPVDPFS